MFKKPVKEICQGDRGAILVPPFKTDEIDRCLITSSNFLKKVKESIVIIQMCKYFKGNVKSKDKFHITIGHQNIMADLYLFISNKKDLAGFQFDTNAANFVKHEFQNEVFKFDFNREYEFVHEINKEKVKIGTRELTHAEVIAEDKVVLAYLIYQKPLFILPHSFYIGSRLDLHAESKLCRIAFSGVSFVDLERVESNTDPFQVKLLSEKKKIGVLEKRFDDYTIIIKDMFKKETNMTLFMGKEVFSEDGKFLGKLSATFGSSGKVKMTLPNTIETIIPNFLDQKVFIINKKYQKIKHS